MAYLPHFDDPGLFWDLNIYFGYGNLHAAISPPSSEMSERKARSKPGPIFPVLPVTTNFSALGNPEKFKEYIQLELPLAFGSLSVTESNSPRALLKVPTTAKLRKDEINSAFLNILLKDPSHAQQRVDTVSAQWIENVVFPNSEYCDSPPFDLNKVKACPQIYNVSKGSYARPPESMGDFEITVWLTNIANNLFATHCSKSLPDDRTFDYTTSTRGPVGGYTLLKPDICVVKEADVSTGSKSLEDRIHWRKIYSFIEVSSQKDGAEAHVLTQIAEKAACIFDAQHQRQFVCALGIFGEPAHLEYVFVVVDRAGQTCTRALKMTGLNFMTFLRIIYAFCFASSKTLGWDESMDLHPVTNEVVSITVHGCEYDSKTPTKVKFDVVKLVHSSPILFGRGTRVWIVKDKENRFFILKDSWVLADTSVSEIHYVQHIEKTIRLDPDGYLFKHACPSYRIGQDCVASTDTVRSMLDDKPPVRHQRRMVTATIGDPITTFRSKREFVAAYLDIVNTLEFFNTKAEVIHGDLSVNNIMINRIWNHEPNKAPSDLRKLACAKGDAQSDIDPSSQSDSTSDDVPAIETVTQPPVLQSLSAAVQTPSNVVKPSPESPNAQPSSLSPDVRQDISAHVSERERSVATPACVSSVGNRGTAEAIESSGMIIDCDFMRSLDEDTYQTSGTLPFMAIEALRPTADGRFRHHAGHDLECLLNTMLTICHYTEGPGGQLRQPMEEDKQITLNKWFVIQNRLDLAIQKWTTLEAFELFILPYLPPYWKDFAPFLQRLIKATYSKMPYILADNIATHKAYRTILVDALDKYTAEEQDRCSVYASVPSANLKRPNDEELTGSSKRQCHEGGGATPNPGRDSVPHFLESFRVHFDQRAVDLEGPDAQDPNSNVGGQWEK